MKTLTSQLSQTARKSDRHPPDCHCCQASSGARRAFSQPLDWNHAKQEKFRSKEKNTNFHTNIQHYTAIQPTIIIHHHTSSYIYTRTSSDVELQLTSWVSQTSAQPRSDDLAISVGRGWEPLFGSVTNHLAGVQNKVGAHRLLKKCFTRLDSSCIFQIVNMHTFRVHMGALTHCSCDIKSWFGTWFLVVMLNRGVENRGKRIVG